MSPLTYSTTNPSHSTSTSGPQYDRPSWKLSRAPPYTSRASENRVSDSPHPPVSTFSPLSSGASTPLSTTSAVPSTGGSSPRSTNTTPLTLHTPPSSCPSYFSREGPPQLPSDENSSESVGSVLDRLCADKFACGRFLRAEFEHRGLTKDEATAAWTELEGEIDPSGGSGRLRDCLSEILSNASSRRGFDHGQDELSERATSYKSDLAAFYGRQGLTRDEIEEALTELGQEISEKELETMEQYLADSMANESLAGRERWTAEPITYDDDEVYYPLGTREFSMGHIRFDKDDLEYLERRAHVLEARGC